MAYAFNRYRAAARSLLLALVIGMSGCQLNFEDPCGLGTRLEGEPTPPAECE